MVSFNINAGGRDKSRIGLVSLLRPKVLGKLSACLSKLALGRTPEQLWRPRLRLVCRALEAVAGPSSIKSLHLYCSPTPSPALRLFPHWQRHLPGVRSLHLSFSTYRAPLEMVLESSRSYSSLRRLRIIGRVTSGMGPVWRGLRANYPYLYSIRLPSYLPAALKTPSLVHWILAVLPHPERLRLLRFRVCAVVDPSLGDCLARFRRLRSFGADLANVGPLPDSCRHLLQSLSIASLDFGAKASLPLEQMGSLRCLRATGALKATARLTAADGRSLLSPGLSRLRLSCGLLSREAVRNWQRLAAALPVLTSLQLDFDFHPAPDPDDLTAFLAVLDGFFNLRQLRLELLNRRSQVNILVELSGAPLELLVLDLGQCGAEVRLGGRTGKTLRELRWTVEAAGRGGLASLRVRGEECLPTNRVDASFVGRRVVSETFGEYTRIRLKR